MLSPGLNELKLFDFPLCLKMEPAKSGGPGIFLQYTQPVKLSSNIRIPGHIVIERKPQWLRAPSTTSWTSADKVENKFGSNPLYLTKTKLISIIQGVSTLWDRPNVITNAYELQKKYAVTNTETDLGTICLYFHHWLQHQRTNKYSVRLNAKVGKTSMFEQ